MLQTGTQVDRYVVEHLVGQGGQASVYQVRHHLLGTRHALKVLHGASPDLRARLVREGRLQARLDPQHVLPVHDVISVNGAPALILPFVRGCSLAELLLHHRVQAGEAVALFLGICEGVGRAHAAGIVHRDIKPANVMLEEKRGRILVRVADFGLAQSHAATDAEEGFDGRRTRAGMVMGSPAYAAPEQLADPSRVDHRADLWSLGVVLFELLTGDLPFQAQTVAELIQLVQTGVFDDSPVPRAFRPVLARLLSPTPDARPDSIEHLRQALTALMVPSPLTLDGPVADVVRTRAAAQAPPQHPVSPRPHGPTIAPDDVAVPGSAAATMVPEDSQLPQHNLPAERDAFVGRQADLEALRQHLAAGVRLISLLGPGGSGKTRLALHHGWQTVDDWPGGVWMCDLSEARSLDGVVYAVSNALGVPLGAGDPIERLGHVIAGRGRCLLLLDNAEQVSSEVRACLEHWMDRASQVHFLVTTRVVLGVAGEHSQPLGTLSPEDSAALFGLRARAAGRHLDRDGAQDETIARLMALLDHLPLAIELAAARSRVLSPDQLLARMADRFRVLTSRGGRNHRHATLRATLTWSWDLLDAWEQSTLAQLSVFQGGFDLEAAESVVSVETGAPWVLDLVQSLVDKSLVRTVSDDRFNLLMTVQTFAAEALAAGGSVSEARRRHATWCAEFGQEEALAALDRHEGVQRREALTQDVYNLVAANRWAVAQGDTDIASRTALAAWAVMSLSGPFRAGAELLQGTFAMSDLTIHQQVQLGRRVGWAQELLGQLDEAERSYEQAHSLATDAGSRREQARVLGNIGNLHRLRGRSEQALQCHQRALDIAIADGDRPTAMVGHGNVAVMLQQVGRFDEARQSYEQAITLARQTGNVHQEGIFLGNLATFHGVRGELDAAGTYFEQALACTRRVGARRSQAIALANLGLVHQQQGRPEQAEQHFQRALALARAVGDRLQQASSQGYLGVLAASQGRLEAAQRYQEAVLHIATQTGSRRREGLASGYLGQLDRINGQLQRARSRLQHALEVHRAAGATYRQPIWLAELSLLDVDQKLPDEALSHITQAVELSAPYPVVHAEVRAAQAQVHLARGEVQAARQALTEGHGLQQGGSVQSLLWAVDAVVALAEADVVRAQHALSQASDEDQPHPPDTPIGRLVHAAQQGLARRAR